MSAGQTFLAFAVGAWQLQSAGDSALFDLSASLTVLTGLFQCLCDPDCVCLESGTGSKTPPESLQLFS